jgi:DNA polymerase-3 subunit delta'
MCYKITKLLKGKLNIAIFTVMQFKDVLGQNELKNHLIEATKGGRVSHAQLFLGPKGSGKLPMAIAYAQYINCTDKLENDSCGVCSNCIKYNSLAHPDLHFVYPVNTTTRIKKEPVSDNFAGEWRSFVKETPYNSMFDWLKYIDIENKQGNISVHESQKIITKLSLKSYEAEFKVMIIWMAEQMNNQSANKLLKILEEPPEKTLFILIADDYEKLLATIISRTQLFKLEMLSEEVIQNQLMNKLSTDSSSAEIIAHSCAGDYSVALKLAKQGVDGEESLNYFRDWMLLCFKKDVVGCLSWVEEVARIGRVRQKNLLTYGIEAFRKAIVRQAVSDDFSLMLGYEKPFLTKFSSFINEVNAMELIMLFNESIHHVERNANAKIVFTDMSLKTIKLLLLKPKAA